MSFGSYFFLALDDKQVDVHGTDIISEAISELDLLVKTSPKFRNTTVFLTGENCTFSIKFHLLFVFTKFISSL